jgi:hypothetical protein
MLKRQQIKSMRKELDKITKSKTSGVFLVDLKDDQYTVRPSNDETILFQGTKTDFEIYKENYDAGIFVIMNIPRPRPISE